MLHPAFTPVNHISAQNRTGFTEKDLSESDWLGPYDRQRRPAAACVYLFLRFFAARFLCKKRGVPTPLKKYRPLYLRSKLPNSDSWKKSKLLHLNPLTPFLRVF